MVGREEKLKRNGASGIWVLGPDLGCQGAGPGMTPSSSQVLSGWGWRLSDPILVPSQLPPSLPGASTMSPG